MKKGLKIVSLSIILVLPVLIYLFLRTFGENQYDLPTFPEANVEIDGCGTFSTSYQLTFLHCASANDAADTLHLKNSNYLIHFPAEDPAVRSIEGNEMRRFLQKTRPLSYSLITFAPVESAAYWQQLAAAETRQAWSVRAECQGADDQFMNCTFLMPLAEVKVGAAAGRLVLLDGQGRIRGYYVPSDKEEIDRLIIEMDVLTKSRK